jgi:hypothetical protein
MSLSTCQFEIQIHHFHSNLSFQPFDDCILLVIYSPRALRSSSNSKTTEVIEFPSFMLNTKQTQQSSLRSLRDCLVCVICTSNVDYIKSKALIKILKWSVWVLSANITPCQKLRNSDTICSRNLQTKTVPNSDYVLMIKLRREIGQIFDAPRD